MKCPTCTIESLQELTLGDARVHSCRECHGVWIGKEELMKGEKVNPEQHWLNIDLWENKQKVNAKVSEKICPVCSTALLSLDQYDAHVSVDMCKTCGGLWLAGGEYQKALDMLKEHADGEIMDNYAGTLATQLKEVITGPKDLTNELADVWAVIKFLKWKVAAQHPVLTQLFEELPFTN